MKKLKSELLTIDEFIKYWRGASKRELRARLKLLKNFGTHKTERKAIETLLS